MIKYFVSVGIFRNVNHAIWFMTTLGIFVVLVLQRIFPEHLSIILLIGTCVHVSPIINAVIVAAKKEDSDLYTRDCITYNMAMLILYGVLYYAIKIGVIR